jgi:hypothetical protein
MNFISTPHYTPHGGAVKADFCCRLSLLFRQPDGLTGYFPPRRRGAKIYNTQFPGGLAAWRENNFLATEDAENTEKKL